MNRRPFLLGTVAIGLAAATLTGCGNGGSGGTTPAASVSMSAPASSPAPGGAAMSPAPVRPGDQVTKQPITRPVTLSGDGRTVTVSATVGGCQQARLLTAESNATVTLTVQLTTQRPAGMACPDFVKLTPVQATLNAPVGNRTVVDGATGKHLTVAGK